MDFDRVTERVTSGLIQGFVVAFVGLATFLPASYVMNRYIYRTRVMRGFMGILAALTGLGGLVILLFLRMYWGDSMKIHYFGMLPILIKEKSVPDDTKTWVVSAFEWLYNKIVEPLLFNYDNDTDINGYKATIESLLETFNNGEQTESNVGGQTFKLNTVYEPFFTFARTVSEIRADNPPPDGEKHYDYPFNRGNPTNSKYNYAGIPSVDTASAIGKTLFGRMSDPLTSEITS